ncbi:MAG TPA: hypothetical protein VGK99_05615 [Acidobacteriota bacterium]|jgi:hypothetical protein
MLYVQNPREREQHPIIPEFLKPSLYMLAAVVGSVLLGHLLGV